MPTYPSIGVALDKAKLASSVTYISLLEIDVLDRTTGAVIEVVRLAHDNQNYTYQGNTYISMPFEFDVKWSKAELPEISLTITDMTLTIHGKLEDSRGATDFPVRILVVSSANPAQAELNESFTVMAAASSAETYEVTLTLGAENPLAMRWPNRLMFRDRCFWKYKGVECGYAGALASCDRSKDGPNGCKVHNNTPNFGGFPGIRRRGY